MHCTYILMYIYTHHNSFWNSYCACTCTCVLCTCISMYVHVKTSGKSKQDTRQCMSQAVYTHIYMYVLYPSDAKYILCTTRFVWDMRLHEKHVRFVYNTHVLFQEQNDFLLIAFFSIAQVLLLTCSFNN